MLHLNFEAAECWSRRHGANIVLLDWLLIYP